MGRAISCQHICTLVFPYNISKINAPRITKLDIDMVHRECCKPIYFGVKGHGHVEQKTTFLSILRRNTTLTFAARFFLCYVHAADAAN